MYKSCPFCGKSKLKVEVKSPSKKYVKGTPYYIITGSIRCNCCHARGPTQSLVFDKQIMTTLEAEKKLTIQLIELWNSRI